jgi:hypothetical protein
MGRVKGKLTKGQPQGSRSASGRKRDRTPTRIAPCDGIVRRRDLYKVAANDTDTVDAIGRAYVAGLLGLGEHARDLLIAGRKIASQYWRVLGFGTPDSLAKFQPQNPFTPLDPAVEKIREDALNVALDLVGQRGRDVRRCFDQLVIDPNPDSGPAWLDRIVYAHRRGNRATEGEYNALRLAVEGLEAIA